MGEGSLFSVSVVCIKQGKGHTNLRYTITLFGYGQFLNLLLKCLELEGYLVGCDQIVDAIFGRPRCSWLVGMRLCVSVCICMRPLLRESFWPEDGAGYRISVRRYDVFSSC